MADAPAALPPPVHNVSRVIALMNQKGGVGKTTTAVHLAAAVASLGRPTLLIDLDPQAHATLHLGATPGDSPSVYRLLTAAARADDAARRVRPNLWLISSETDLAAAETELASVPSRETVLARALAPILPRFEFVFMDCPPSLGLLTLNALAAAREVLAPMQAHFLALQGVGKLLETVRLISAGVNPRLRVAGVILCMHEDTTRLSREVVADLETFFTQARAEGAEDSPWKAARVYRPAVRRNVKLAECPSFGQTVFEYAPGALSASDYRALGETLVKEWDAMLAFRRSRVQRDAAPGHTSASDSIAADNQPPATIVVTGGRPAAAGHAPTR